MPDDFVRGMAALGPAEEIRLLANRFVEAGATTTVVSPGLHAEGGPASVMTAPASAEFEEVLRVAAAARSSPF
jgi:hypothetical protein